MASPHPAMEIAITDDSCNNGNDYGRIEGSEDNCYCLFLNSKCDLQTRALNQFNFGCCFTISPHAGMVNLLPFHTENKNNIHLLTSRVMNIN